MTLQQLIGHLSQGRLAMIPTPGGQIIIPSQTHPSHTKAPLTQHEHTPPLSLNIPSPLYTPTAPQRFAFPTPSSQHSTPIITTVIPPTPTLTPTPTPTLTPTLTPTAHPTLTAPNPSSFQLGQRSASSPQLHRGSRGDLHDLLTLTPTYPLKGIFDIGSGHFDVVLDRVQLSWTPIQGSSHGKGEHYPKVLRIQDVFAVQIQRIQRAGQEVGGHPRGVSIFAAMPKRGVPNGLTWEEVTLVSSNESCCQQWFQAVLQLLNAFSQRPRRVQVFIDSLTSSKARHVFEERVKMLLHFARVQMDVVERNHKWHVRDVLENADFDNVDGVICVGGDVIVNEAVHGLLQRAQRDAGISISPDTPMAKCRIPLGIIPVGLFNVVAHSTHGVCDPVTSVLHIILGHLQPVDVCSVYNEEGFLRFGFSAMYGFGSDSLRRAAKTQNLLKSRSVEYAVAKSLLKLRAFECEVSYVPYESDHIPGANAEPAASCCMNGCGVCGYAPELRGLVCSPHAPLRPQDSPFAIRKSRPDRPQSSEPTAGLRSASPGGLRTGGRGNMGASVPSIPLIAWGLDTGQDVPDEGGLLIPSRRKEEERKAATFREASHRPPASAPNSRPSSAAWGDTTINADTNQSEACPLGFGQSEASIRTDIPKVNITRTSSSETGIQRRGIGILPRSDPSAKEDWRVFQDSFLNVGIITLPSRSLLVPRGLSPSTHLADGAADLVLVRKVNRKEFMRFVRHHGTEEDQFSVPFVWRHAVKAVQIRPVLQGAEGNMDSHTKLLTWNLDMELIQAAFLEMRVHRQLLAIFGQGIHDDDFPTTSCRCL